MRISRHKRLVLGVVLVPTLLGLTACGGGSQTYATDKSDGVYFTVPEHWQKLSQSALSAREAQSTVAGAADRLANVHWQEAYAPSALTAAQVFSLKSNGYPTVYVRVRSLLPDEVNSFSLNSHCGAWTLGLFFVPKKFNNHLQYVLFKYAVLVIN